MVKRKTKAKGKAKSLTKGKAKTKTKTKTKTLNKVVAKTKTTTKAKTKTPTKKRARTLAKVKANSKAKTKALFSSKSVAQERSSTKSRKKKASTGGVLIGTRQKTTKIGAKSLGKKEADNKTKKTLTKRVKKFRIKFKVGDSVVYPTHGVGLVTGIEQESIAGQILELIVVTFDSERMTLRVPTEKVKNSGLREISSSEKMNEAITTLKGRARIKRTMWSRRAQEYETKINSGDPVAIAKVIRDLYRNVGQPDQSFSERQIYEQALMRLAGEVAAMDETNIERAVEKLEEVLSAQ